MSQSAVHHLAHPTPLAHAQGDHLLPDIALLPLTFLPVTLIARFKGEPLLVDVPLEGRCALNLNRSKIQWLSDVFAAFFY